MPAKTETAVDSADPTCYDQEPALILSQKSGPADGARLPQGVGHELRRVGQFRLAGQDLGQERIIGIARPDSGQIRFGHEEAETARRLGGLDPPLFRQPEPAAEFERIADRAGQDGPPVVATRRPAGDRAAGRVRGAAVRCEHARESFHNGQS